MAFPLSALLAACACGSERGREGAPEAEASPESGQLDAPDERRSGPGASDSSPPTAAAGDEAGEATPPLRTYRLLLVNPGPVGAIVYASAGAEPVLLDTVPARDSVRVNVVVRSERLRLEARDAEGAVRDSATVSLDPARPARWSVGEGKEVP